MASGKMVLVLCMVLTVIVSTTLASEYTSAGGGFTGRNSGGVDFSGRRPRGRALRGDAPGERVYPRGQPQARRKG